MVTPSEEEQGERKSGEGQIKFGSGAICWRGLKRALGQE